MAYLVGIFSALGVWAIARGLGRLSASGFRNPVRVPSGESTRLWLLWWAWLGGGAIAGAAALGHPAAGLTGALAFPWARAGWLGWRSRVTAGELGDSALVFFRGLQSLLKAGLSLPAALFRLTETSDTSFARRLRVALEGFGRGRSISHCLGRFRHRTGLAQAGLCLDILERAHGRGLALAPFLDRVLPWLEEEARERKRIEEARKSALAQACLASVLPWGVAAFASGWMKGPGWFGAAALAVQLVGLFIVDKMARFE